MKKLLFSLICILTIISAVGQDYTAWHSKYWYYRTRLRNDFMKVGLGQGCSIPMEQRGLGYEPINYNYIFTNNPADGAQAQWGDAMGELGYYIGILATEYHMLAKNNQETDSVRYELYCALEALNRMDYWAETAFTQAIANSTNPQSFSPAYDGFMVRDDVPIDFIQNNMKSFNYYGNKGFCSRIKLNTVVSSSGNGAITQGESYVQPNGPGTNGHWEKHYAGSYISQDNWINCIVGLALVRKFIPSGESYKGLSFSDGNGSDMKQEAFSIALRVMNYFKQDASWLAKYPAGNFIGSDWGGIGTGLAFAHAEALNKIDQNRWGHYVQPNQASFDTWCEYNDWRKQGNVFQVFYNNVILIPYMYLAYAFSSHASGSLGNIYTQNPIPVMPSAEMAYKYAQLYPSASNPDVAVQVSNLSAVCNCEYTFRGVDTKHQLQHHINEHQIWHPELLRVILHGEGDCFTTDLNPSYYNAAVSLISNAPCEGPYNWIGDNVYGPDSPAEWHTQTQLDHPEGRNTNGLVGEFNGIDYMFYHNLITIIDGDKNVWYDDKQMVDFGRRHINKNYPLQIGNTTWGTTTKPAVVKAYEYILANNTVGTSAFTDVSFLAGKEITLVDGFSATSQGYFTAAIQYFECDEIMSNPLNPSVNGRSSNANNGDQKNDRTIYPDMLPTSYETAKTEEVFTEESAPVNYNPTLVHIDSLIIKPQTTLNDNIVAQLSPNPSTGLTKLIITKPELVKIVDVVDPLGRQLFSFSSISISNDIELSGMGKGVYSIIIKGIENDVLVKKVVIQ